MADITSAFAANIISAEDTLSLIAKGRQVVFLDVRFSPKQQDLKREYDLEHIDGAHYVDLKTQLQAAGGGLAGSRPLPVLADLQQNIERWGLHPATTVIVYTHTTPAAAARAWFVLRWAGLFDVRYLDGGLDAWKSAGGKTSASEPKTGGGTFVIGSADQLKTLSASDVAGYIDAGYKVFDARGAEGFAGDGSPRSGHIPGARHLPAGAFLDTEGRILAPSKIRRILEDNGVQAHEPIGVYCGGGVAGALETLILRSIGIDAHLFVGSFSAWAADPQRAVATGFDR